MVRDTEGEWLSWLGAAEVIGCSPRTVEGLIARGELPVARPGSRSVRSLRRSDVEAVARTWRARQAERTARGEARRRQRAAARPRSPIPPGHLTTGQVAHLIGYTPQGVAKLSRLGRIPSTQLPDGQHVYDVEAVIMFIRCRRVTANREALLGAGGKLP